MALMTSKRRWEKAQAATRKQDKRRWSPSVPNEPGVREIKGNALEALRVAGLEQLRPGGTLRE